MTVDALLELVAAADTTADRDRLRRTVMDTLEVLGLVVDPRTRRILMPVPASERVRLG